MVWQGVTYEFGQIIDVLPGGGHDADQPVADGVAHQVEEMAAFLDQCSPGQAGKPVPVPHLGQEREPVLTNGQNFALQVAAFILLRNSAIGSMSRYSIATQTGDAVLAETHRALPSCFGGVNSGFSTITGTGCNGDDRFKLIQM
ncbi:MAG: hypothetical protein OXJ64_01200 [Boseongicola sp.]|nr:hypothetical protein [Boseongicola sp.]